MNQIMTGKLWGTDWIYESLLGQEFKAQTLAHQLRELLGEEQELVRDKFTRFREESVACSCLPQVP